MHIIKGNALLKSCKITWRTWQLRTSLEPNFLSEDNLGRCDRARQSIALSQTSSCSVSHIWILLQNQSRRPCHPDLPGPAQTITDLSTTQQSFGTGQHWANACLLVRFGGEFPGFAIMATARGAAVEQEGSKPAQIAFGWLLTDWVCPWRSSTGQGRTTGSAPCRPLSG